MRKFSYDESGAVFSTGMEQVMKNCLCVLPNVQ